MAKKKIPSRNRGVDPIELKIDLENFKKVDYEEPKEEEEDKEVSVKKITLIPVGYPIKLKDSPDAIANAIKIDDADLFQAYASDQFAGLSVRKEEYLFDQMILPDFAFRIIDLEPQDATRLTLDTEFIVQNIPEPEVIFERVSFDDIIGQEDAKNKCMIVKECIKHPEKFGSWMPKNILFYGEPGTGKTLMARALASEAGIPIISQKGTSLIGLHVGDGAAKIHNLYKDARDHGPSIIFIDELDAIGLSRSFQSVRGDVVEVSTALLAEMDGLEQNKGVITIAATNTIDLLDSGLRSRFEEEIEFKIPNDKERIAILKLYLSKLNAKVTVNYAEISKMLDGCSGRDIKEKVLKNTVYNLILGKIKEITTADLITTINRVLKVQKRENIYT
jgi:AAA family ATPase